MTVRTSKKTVTFAQPFTLGDDEEVFQPGTYDVETDEERLEGVSFEAYRRVQTLVHLPPTPATPGRSRTLTVDPDDLEAALARDAAGSTQTAPDLRTAR